MLYIDKPHTRTIKVRGIADPESNIESYVDGVLCKRGPITGDILFEFQTPVYYHGALPILIKVNSGKITLGDSIVTYPALINQTVSGYFSFKIPLDDLIIKTFDQYITRYKNYSLTINAGETFIGNHLLVNGPSRWIITLDTDHVYEGMNIFTEDVDTPVSLITGIDVEFSYECFEPYHKNNSLDQLINKLVSTKKNQL